MLQTQALLGGGVDGDSVDRVEAAFGLRRQLQEPQEAQEPRGGFKRFTVSCLGFRVRPRQPSHSPPKRASV